MPKVPLEEDGLGEEYAGEIISISLYMSLLYALLK